MNVKKYNIPIFVPHKGCPFDCVFCNQNRITGHIKEVTPDEVTETIERYLTTIPKNSKIETAFFGGSFTGIPMEEQNALMERVQPYIKSGKIDGIRLSTRPDYINIEILDNLKEHGVTTIELGVQSMCDSVLKAANRGHTSQQVIDAVKIIRKYDINIGLQMMTGLPGDNDEHSIETAKQLIKLQPECVRIYPTLTIRDTYLEKLYYMGKYKPQTLDEAVELAKKLLIMFEKSGINVIRLGLQPTEEINDHASVIAGPFHSSFRELVENEIYYDIILKHLNGKIGEFEVFVAPSEISKVVGNKRKNIIRLAERNIKIKIKSDKTMKKREVRCICC